MQALATLLGGRHGTVTVTDDAVVIRYGAIFSIDVPRVAIRSVTRTTVSWWWGIGAHMWKGRWVVNASLRDPVEVVVDPPQRGRMFGLFHGTVRAMVLSVEDTDGLIAVAGSGPAGG
jgi:hypothetical protein